MVSLHKKPFIVVLYIQSKTANAWCNNLVDSLANVVTRIISLLFEHTEWDETTKLSNDVIIWDLNIKIKYNSFIYSN